MADAAATRRIQEPTVEGSRLRILLIFAPEAVHGYQPIPPIPLDEAASWDLEAIERSAGLAATEASAAGLHWTFTPMVDIRRDARRGGIMEAGRTRKLQGVHRLERDRPECG